MNMQITDAIIDANQQNVSISDGESETANIVRARILHILEIYPFLSSSMIHIGLGTSLPISLWKPILATLVTEEAVCLTEVTSRTPIGRMQTFSIYHLPKNTWNGDTTA
jgi:hypothetical protein